MTISPMAPGDAEWDARLRVCRDRRLVVFALELVPRISRAQDMDVLSSQATVAGYRGALAAAERLPAFFPMLSTAAGTVGPARVLVLGTGVAGLQAIATARRLGAEVTAHDIRPSSAEEVRSLGATFLALEDPAGKQGAGSDAGGYARVVGEDVLAAQRRLLAAPIAESDAVITTAAVPGRRAPLLVTARMVERMRPGSVVVDLAAETGGNCELTRPGEQVEHAGVVVLGPRNAPSDLPLQASELFAANVATLLLLMTKDGTLAPDFTDDVLAGCCVTRDGELLQPGVPGPDPAEGRPPRRPVREGNVDEVADLLASSRRVVLVPGFGLAVAQAQHALVVLAGLLADRGVEVAYAISPVAGRVPGQMNVLLDGAGVPHAQLEDVQQANAAFPRTDVALVVGANDIVNPAARSPGSPLSGMPVLDVAAARRVVVLERSPGPGFAGIDNPLFDDERTTVLSGDARETLVALAAAFVAFGHEQ